MVAFYDIEDSLINTARYESNKKFFYIEHIENEMKHYYQNGPRFDKSFMLSLFYKDMINAWCINDLEDKGIGISNQTAYDICFNEYGQH